MLSTAVALSRSCFTAKSFSRSITRSCALISARKISASDGDAASEGYGACAPPTKKAVQGSAKTRDESSDCGSSDDSEDDDDGFYVSVPRPRRGFHCQYWDKIGATFRDSDDNITFRITDVCKSGSK